MKRVLRSIVLLSMTLIFLVGCTMKENIVFKVDSDKKMTVKLIVAMDDEMIDTMITMSEDSNFDYENEKIPEHSDKERWEYLEKDDDSLKEPPEGFKSEKYDKDGFKGYVYSKEVGTIDDVTKESAKERYNILGDESSDDKEDKDDEDSEGSSGNVDVETLLKETLFTKKGNVYKSNMTIKSEDSSSYDQYKSAGAALDLKFVLELPNKPISNNATEVSKDGKTLTWDLTKNSDIDVEFKLGNNTLLYVGIGAGVLVVAGILAGVLTKKKGDGTDSKAE